MKVKGPCFSLTATGVLYNLLEFRTLAASGVVCRRRPRRQRSSPAQAAHNLRYSNGCAAWSGATTGLKNSWKSAAPATYTSGFHYFIAEYIYQQITPPGMPVIP